MPDIAKKELAAMISRLIGKQPMTLSPRPLTGYNIVIAVEFWFGSSEAGLAYEFRQFDMTRPEASPGCFEPDRPIGMAFNDTTARAT